MTRCLILLCVFFVSVAAGCGMNYDLKSKASEPSLLPTSGDYTFQRYIEEKEQNEYRVLYSQVPDSKIVQVKLVQELAKNGTTEIAEANNFYEEFTDGIYGYVVLSEDFPKEWTAKDISAFPKTKIISYPLEKGKKWTEEIPDLGVKITYHMRSIDESLETPAKSFHNLVVIDFEEKDLNGTSLKKGTSTFAPKFGWIRYVTEDQYLKDVHELIKINE